MSADRRARFSLRAFFDQLFFYFAIFSGTFAVASVCHGGLFPLRRFLVLVLFCSPLALVSSLFAGQVAVAQPPPAPQRERAAMREIKPHTVPTPWPVQHAAEERRRAA